MHKLEAESSSQLIITGGRRVGGTVINMINDVSDYNPNRLFYINEATKEFDGLQDNPPKIFRFGGL